MNNYIYWNGYTVDPCAEIMKEFSNISREQFHCILRKAFLKSIHLTARCDKILMESGDVSVEAFKCLLKILFDKGFNSINTLKVRKSFKYFVNLSSKKIQLFPPPVSSEDVSG